MLKKAQFAWNVDLIGGVILLIIGFVIFTVLFNVQELKSEEKHEIEINLFEQEQNRLDLLNLVSDEEIFEILTNFEEVKNQYYDQELIGFDNIQNTYFCKNELSEKFQNLINSDSYFFIASIENNDYFQCYYDTITKKTIRENITLPSKNPEQTIFVELNKK